LSESIVRRAQDAKRPAALPSSENAPMPLPKLTIGRTRRAWVWASLAVAVGLVIMILQREPAEERASVALRRREPPSLTAAPNSEMLDRSRAAGRELAESEPRMAPSATGAASRAADSDSPDSFGAISEIESADEAGDQQFVVVHVLAKRAAMENKVFDQLLLSNGIAMVPAGDDSDVADGVLREEGVSSRLSQQRPAAPPADEKQDMDVVLVEAPPKKIETFMDQLNRDYTNYLGLSVDEAAPADKAFARKAVPTKKLANDLGKYSRGNVSLEQKALFERNKDFYYHEPAQGAPPSGGIGRALDTVGGVKLDKNERRLATELYANEGRAQRLSVPKSDDRQVADQLSRARKLEVPFEPASDQLQVLFVLTPGDEPAASPTGENPTK
jgi:hypothetical protein